VLGSQTELAGKSSVNSPATFTVPPDGVMSKSTPLGTSRAYDAAVELNAAAEGADVFAVAWVGLIVLSPQATTLSTTALATIAEMVRRMTRIKIAVGWQRRGIADTTRPRVDTPWQNTRYGLTSVRASVRLNYYGGDAVTRQSETRNVWPFPYIQARRLDQRSVE